MAARKNQKKFEQLMKTNWDDKIIMLKDQMNQIKQKPRLMQQQQSKLTIRLKEP